LIILRITCPVGTAPIVPPFRYLSAPPTCQRQQLVSPSSPIFSLGKRESGALPGTNTQTRIANIRDFFLVESCMSPATCCHTICLRVWQASGFTRWERLSHSCLPVRTVSGRLASLDYNLLKLSISSRALGKGLRNIPSQSLTKHITPANVPAEPPAGETKVTLNTIISALVRVFWRFHRSYTHTSHRP